VIDARRQIENRPLRVKSFTTSEGSVYTYDKDGKTTRFKTATREQYPKQDLTIFVDLSIDEAGKALMGVHRGTHKVQIVEVAPDDTIKGVISDINQVEDPDSLAFSMAQGDEWTLFKPASTTPQIGWRVFDQRTYEKDGTKHTQQHLGNEITSIEFEPA
jgi:hypothetical protein